MEKTLSLEAKKATFALAGNPNVGKTSLFNALTGARQHVGNWPGVTVERKEGTLLYEGKIFRVVDLPGIYSLGAYAEDELVARNFILFGHPEVVINVVDATNLERNLYLTVQLLEMGAKVVIALNMFDEVKKHRISLDVEKLSAFLKTPVVPTVASRNEGAKELVAQAVACAKASLPEPLRINYGIEMEGEIEKLETKIATSPRLAKRYPPRWLAVKLLEGDEYLLGELRKTGEADLLCQLAVSVNHLRTRLGEEVETLIAERRYGFINGLAKEVIKSTPSLEVRLTISDRIDRVVTNEYLGFPIFLGVMVILFQLAFGLGGFLSSYFELFFAFLGSLAGKTIGNELLASFFKDGLIGGVGSVLVFIPPLFLLFLVISFLEDSGYLARGACVTDRFMHLLGLHGKSFLPLLLGFGCNVPAVMATRTLENKADRLVTILIIPLVSCAARLPVYTLFASVFFPGSQTLVIFSLYFLGITLVVVLGRFFKKLFFPGEAPLFVLELPPYRLPTFKGALIHTWERGGAFIRKAGTVILGAVVLVWLLANLPPGVPYASPESLMGRLGAFFAPFLTPAGFGTREAAAALLFGLAAKEAIISTLGVLYGVGEEGLGKVITQFWTPLSAYAFMVFVLVYIPCAATIGTIRRETNSWGWAAFAVGYTLFLGWLLAVLIYQAGRLLGF